jgi:hypothetical protein
MPLEIIRTVRDAVTAGEPLRQSDVLALCATTDQLWHQIVGQSEPRTPEHRRTYMREYMRRYRAVKRETLAPAVIANESGPH